MEKEDFRVERDDTGRQLKESIMEWIWVGSETDMMWCPAQDVYLASE